MLAESAVELVNRCYEQRNNLFTLEEMKEDFITFVFGSYQDEIVMTHGLDRFYEHLDDLHLTNCRKDFDKAVEDWYLLYYGCQNEEANYHDILFILVKEALLVNQSDNRETLMRDVTKLLTSPTGFMSRWRGGDDRKLTTYFKYLNQLGIRTYEDIEAIVDMWLLENPNAFDRRHQQLLAKSRRGRPNNVELSLLLEMACQLKPELTPQERERIRKIYYYHRKSLTMREMMEKFKKYIVSKNKANNSHAG
ncbi:hypothetical protein [Brevibacillus sp. H7]|uniref:hypothetical protein n=1 Tax=Brevibacillus sp. H7 TaxID=3349138 RepID=UPI0037FC3147